MSKNATLAVTWAEILGSQVFLPLPGRVLVFCGGECFPGDSRVHCAQVQHVMSCIVCHMATRAGGPLHWGSAFVLQLLVALFSILLQGNFFCSALELSVLSG